MADNLYAAFRMVTVLAVERVQLGMLSWFFYSLILGCPAAFVFTFMASGLLLCYHEAQQVYTFSSGITEQLSNYASYRW